MAGTGIIVSCFSRKEGAPKKVVSSARIAEGTQSVRSCASFTKRTPDSLGPVVVLKMREIEKKQSGGKQLVMVVEPMDCRGCVRYENDTYIGVERM